MTPDLFEDAPREVALGEGAVPLGGFARPFEAALPPVALRRHHSVGSSPKGTMALDAVVAAAPFRHMHTPGGHRMSVAMTDCGAVGWVTDRTGHRHDPADPEGGLAWPTMPDAFADLARRAAVRAGFPGFSPDACLVDRYEPGARLSSHQDENERGFDAPIVSVSLGLAATFLFGGAKRSDPPRRVAPRHGDVAVWGGPSRLAHHGILSLAEGEHPVLGRRRINPTFRRAL